MHPHNKTHLNHLKRTVESQEAELEKLRETIHIVASNLEVEPIELIDASIQMRQILKKLDYVLATEPDIFNLLSEIDPSNN